VQQKLKNLHTDHVMLQSELKYLIGVIIVNLKCRGFGGKTRPLPMVRVFRVVRPAATLWLGWTCTGKRPGNLDPLLTQTQVQTLPGRPLHVGVLDR
jgi:hypothetical protein